MLTTVHGIQRLVRGISSMIVNSLSEDEAQSNGRYEEDNRGEDDQEHQKRQGHKRQKGDNEASDN